ncbi:hypothetical protein CPB83DRAFT_443183 [Crepidotus variabilis]|uniref:Neutral metalloproteinase n=1 Tax=Crepidotus variabilis TaxID=179855 RepID=A0A9P6JNQ3_9AGAR|nr:hypothetical protein CPB83DRAFT_443183 [Crepidotus variabilis]
MSAKAVKPNHAACCSVIPTYILSNIADSPHAPEAARTHARNALAHTLNFIQKHQNSITHQLSITQAHPGANQGQSFVPDHILNSIASSHPAGSEGEEAAQRSLRISSEIRDRREAESDSLRGAAPAKPAKRLNRVIYNANHTQILDESLARSEKGPATGDTAVDECFDGFGATFKFYADIFNRNSINNAGMSLIGTVHFDNAYNNAQWDGSQMIFGDGDGIYFNRFTASVDVIGHELTHGVTQYTANLVYQGESGALNESVSDVFGSMIKQFQHNQTSAQADWLIGEGLFTSKVKGVALRSMKAPGTAYDDPVIGKDEQFANYADVLKAELASDFDNGGVHIISGVPNRAFYLVASELGGNSWDRAGKIWWATLTDRRLTPSSNFQAFAKLTTEQAGNLYGESVKTAVENAWKEVGIDTGAKTSPVPKPHHPHAQNI